jgi:hypothetical protein
MIVRKAKLHAGFFSLILSLAILLLGRGARADEQSIIKQPGDHPRYAVEIEPHVVFAAFLPRAGNTGFGLGGRFSIPLVHNGFVSTINNNVAIGFGLDWIHYNGCYRGYYFVNGYCSDLNSFVLPVVLQWNFFLSTHWSVFGEPGLALTYASYQGDCLAYDNAGRPIGPSCPSTLNVEPFVFFVGGRYHFSESVALTMRVGYPYFSVGASFM